MEKEINDYVLRLTGKVSLLQPIEIGKNYKVIISGSITSSELKDNHDGTFNSYYKFEPVLVETINELGETIKSKDPRSKSKLLRACLYQDWKNIPNNKSDEDFYDFVMDYIIRNHDIIVEKALII